MAELNSQLYTNATIVDAEGARVAFIQCRRCGDALLLDPREKFDPVEAHNNFHKNFTRTVRRADGAPVRY